jgi:hypothetical protein
MHANEVQPLRLADLLDFVHSAAFGALSAGGVVVAAVVVACVY